MGVIFGAMNYPEPGNPHIPTGGLPGTVLDFYRAKFLVTDEYLKDNPGLLDYAMCDDLAVFESEILTFDQILRFENLVRFIILQDRIDILTPSVKFVDKASGLTSYARLSDNRKESTLSVLHAIGAHDFLFPSEKITIFNNKVIASTLDNSSFIETERQSLKDLLLIDRSQKIILQTLPASISVPFISNVNENSESFNFLYKSYLDSLDKQWTFNTNFTIKAGYDIPLPFFTNAVLSIAKNRDDIPNAVLNLRDDLAALRKQLFKFLNDLKGIKTPLEQSALHRDIETAILTYTTRLFEQSNFVSDMVRLVVDILTKPIETPAKIMNPDFHLANEYPILFGNSNFKRLRGYLRLDNLNTNIHNFLTESEIRRLKDGSA